MVVVVGVVVVFDPVSKTAVISLDSPNLTSIGTFHFNPFNITSNVILIR